MPGTVIATIGLGNLGMFVLIFGILKRATVYGIGILEEKLV